ncbi:MAG: ABC transporter ATP-binding protein [Gorillibacterium sp.]|nr:ABC transporter ATP-binding protein [Gorillibacterium sp.]
MIQLKDVSFLYKEKTALERVNLHVHTGEAVAILGPNGSGKSTLLKLLNGLVFPSEGSYRFDQMEISQALLKDPTISKRFHQRVGFVFQNSDTQLFCSTVFEEVAFGPMQMGLPEAEVHRRVRDCLALLHIEKISDEHPYNLSGGEKKRTAIAAVLAMNPEVIVLDEPMNGIDPKGKAFLRELLIRLNRSGKTILCATHDFQYLDGVFSRAIVFSEGHRIIRDDSYTHVMADTTFLAMHNMI